jgi:hypothetical protein
MDDELIGLDSYSLRGSDPAPAAVYIPERLSPIFDEGDAADGDVDPDACPECGGSGNRCEYSFVFGFWMEFSCKLCGGTGARQDTEDRLIEEAVELRRQTAGSDEQIVFDDMEPY